MLTINMIPVADFKPSVAGKYLVKTISTSPLKSIDVFTARLSVDNNTGKISFDVSNQTVTHVSMLPVL